MNTSIDRFSDNIEAFQKAADYIHQHCVEFAGRSVRAQLSPWAFMVLSKDFSHCEPAARAYIYDCTVSADGYLIPATAEVSIDGKVVFRANH